jgi:hypothetical protein
MVSGKDKIVAVLPYYHIYGLSSLSFFPPLPPLPPLPPFLLSSGDIENLPFPPTSPIISPSQRSETQCGNAKENEMSQASRP